MKRVIVQWSVTIEGERDPEIIGTFRERLQDDERLEDALERAAKNACRQLHAPQYAYTLA